MAKKRSTLERATAAVKGAATSVGKAVGIIGTKKTKKKSTAKKSAARKKPATRKKSTAKKK
jgi:hypothetical protein